MHKSFEWTTVGIEDRLAALGAWIARERACLLPSQTHDYVKMSHWLTSLRRIRTAIGGVKAVVQPLIEADLGYAVKNDELLLVAMFQPSTRNLFDEINTHFRDREDRALSHEDLAALAVLPKGAGTLAWIGDAALKIGVLHEIWTPEIAAAGDLTEQRMRYDSNANMARLCDRWQLYEHRIGIDNDVHARDLDHHKGTLVEAIFGIIFLQEGMKAVGTASRLLTPPADEGGGAA